MVFELLLFIFILLSAFFSSAETALMLLPEYKVREFVRNKFTFAKILEKIKKDQKKLIITILIGNNIVNIGASAIATKIAIDYFGNVGAGIATGIMTLIILIFGEVTPKTFATEYFEKLSLVYAPIIYVLMIVFYPLIWLLQLITKLILRKKSNNEFSEKEILSVLKLGSEKRVIDRDERELMENILELDDTKISEIMIKKKDVFMLPEDMPFYQALNEIVKKLYSRIVIYDEYSKEITGYIHIKDMLKNIGKSNMKLKEIKRQLLFVNYNDKVDDVLEKMQENSVHIAGVKKKGKFIGIVTLEDLIEEVFGEIYDELDINPRRWQKINKNILLVHANTKIGKLNHFFRGLIPEKFNNLTVLELISSRLSSFAPDNYVIMYGLKFKIENIVNGKPRIIRIIKQKIKSKN